MLRRQIKFLVPTMAVLVISLALEPVNAQQPRVVIAAEKIPGSLSAHERYLLSQLDWVGTLESRLQSSRSVQILSRDAYDMRAILEEQRLAESSLAAESGQQFGLKVSDSVLRPTLVKFDVYTSYQPVELLDDVFERSDSVRFEFKVEVIGVDGAVRFSRNVSGRYAWPTIEESVDEKRQGRYRTAQPLKARTDEAVGEIVDAISIRINPISIVDVNPDYFVIDRGADAGLAIGDQYKVFARSKIVELPNGTKKRIPGITVGEAVVTEVHEDIAFATFSPIEGREMGIEVGFTLRESGASK